jgi:hypothetical protein
MPRVAPRVPELSEILCSQCGYVLNGLPEGGNCPECGRPIADSIGVERIPPVWESASSGHRVQGFVKTTIEVIRRPKHFYRTFTVRGPLADSRRFARIHWWIAAVLFGLAGATHGVWYNYFVANAITNFPGGRWAMFASLVLGLTIASYLFLDGITRLAARLTTLEATYRGFRLPYDIVLRGMYYHAAHYLPVAISAAVVVIGFQCLPAPGTGGMPFNTPMIYLWVLAGQVVVSALYLFQTYWIGMRNMMFANR